MRDSAERDSAERSISWPHPPSLAALVPALVFWFLKQAVERSACVVRVARRGDVGRRSGLRWCGRGGITRHRYAGPEQGAIVRLVLRRDACWDGFGALEPRGRLEVGALLAAVERCVALRALNREVGTGWKLGRAIEATRRRYRLHQPRQTRSGNVDGWPGARRPRAFLTPGIVAIGELTVVVAAGFLVAALLVLTVAFHKVAGWHSFVNVARTGWRSVIFGYERRQSSQTRGALGAGLLNYCLNHYVPRNGRGIQRNLLY